MYDNDTYQTYYNRLHWDFSCEQTTDMLRKRTLITPPKTLMVVLKRYKNRQKIAAPVLAKERATVILY